MGLEEDIATVLVRGGAEELLRRVTRDWLRAGCGDGFILAGGPAGS